ncbi:MAG: hypothetical protein CFE23_16620 [Flavobacterium sp. BFFFF1]|uniref:hypothetical protein n=1 Tax=Flavobacterium sp. BFFFF1 TaxID=2015557 RepID=UPI000BDDBE9E|nr:hypothetical protein [Flavobacterium sp. BFFFF1]OYU78864.1 MAG: hypothetical protein CFE23_16620 [Flavobacterium sp. BFFFF1]
MKNFEGTLRLCIHTKDVVVITGYSEGYSRRIIREIKAKYNKEPQHAVTISDLCEYLGLKEEEVRKRIH